MMSTRHTVADLTEPQIPGSKNENSLRSKNRNSALNNENSALRCYVCTLKMQ